MPLRISKNRIALSNIPLQLGKSASIASASTVDLSTATGNEVHITGSTGPITSFGTVPAGTEYTLIFDSTPTITYNASSMILNTGATNYTCSAGDRARALSEGGGNWVVTIHRVDGSPAISVVTLTSSQIASPSAGVLANTSVTYQLSTAPYTRYVSNGTSLVAIAGKTSPQNTCYIIGDSLGAQDNYTPSGGYQQISANAIIYSLNARLGQRLNITYMTPSTGVTGAVSGTRSDVILGTVATALQTFPGYVAIFAGANDVAQFNGTTLTNGTNLYTQGPCTGLPISPDNYQTTMLAMVNQIIAAGATPILFGIPGSAATITTNIMSDMWVACNQRLRNIARIVPGVLFVPTDSSYIDSTAARPAGIAGYCDGSWHPNSLGASKLADDSFTVLDKYIPAVDLFPSHYHASSTDIMALVGNPLMLGTQAAGSGLTGNVPSAGVTMSVGGTGSGVASLVARTDVYSGAQWCQVAYTGPASAVWNTDFVRANTTAVSIATAGLSVGDWIQGYWEYYSTAQSTNFLGVEVFVIFTGSTGTYTRAWGNKQNNGAAPLVKLGTKLQNYAVFNTPRIQIPTGTTSISLYIQAHPVAGSNGATFTANFGRHWFIKG